MKKKGGLVRSAYAESVTNEPDEITATVDSIEMVVFFDGEERSRVVRLRPRHIEAIAAMKDDWWDSRWAAVHEAEA